MNKELSDRMKEYEFQYSKNKLLPLIPIVARIDGRAFHSFTKGLKKPYDLRLSKLMKDTTVFLCEESNATLGYTQSDEISLIWNNTNINTETFFDGKILKLTSILSSLTTAFFNKNLAEYIPEKANKLAIFDCRVFNIPTHDETLQYLLWRESDATRNSINMAAQQYYSHKELLKKSLKKTQELLFQAGINWNDYPPFFKRGTYIKRTKKLVKFSPKEIQKLPKNHEARKNPNLMIERSIYSRLRLDKISSLNYPIGLLL